MLHLAFRGYTDLETASSGEGLHRFVVAYPKGYEHHDTRPPRQDRSPGRRR
jgi:spoIIIJ-associated protein